MWRASIVLIACAGASSPAQAYLDPGVAYAALQPLLIAIAGASAAVVGYKDKILRWMGVDGRKPGDKDGGEALTASASESSDRSPG